jgi:hypothetical protein
MLLGVNDFLKQKKIEKKNQIITSFWHFLVQNSLEKAYIFGRA